MSGSSHQNIYLSGFMGSGKSTVGRLLANKLGRCFIDTDLVIEQQTGMSVSAYFSQNGESAFRALESKILKTFAQKHNLVVSLGGGAILSPFNRDELKRSGTWIYLHVPLSVIKSRLINNTTRPLLKGSPNAIDALYTRRLPLYKLAPIMIDCGNLSADAVCLAIQNKLPNP